MPTVLKLRIGLSERVITTFAEEIVLRSNPTAVYAPGRVMVSVSGPTNDGCVCVDMLPPPDAEFVL